MGKGKIGAQRSCAAVSAYKQMHRRKLQVFKEWENCGELKVVVKASDEDNLVNLLINAKILGLIINFIQYSGYTQIEPGFQTALEHEPGAVRLIDEVTSYIELY
ncbi:Peptidyl-tRNA hydrolase 2, mitochondrial [Lemmus lemmus]